MTDASLHDSIFVGAFFTETILRSCNTSKAHFDRGHFRKTHLEGVTFSDCWLDGAYFDEARLVRTDYYEASLSNASFTDSHFERANLRDVDLSQVRNLTWRQLAGAAINDRTCLPCELEPTRSVMVEGFFIRSDGDLMEQAER